ncbi:MAG: phosphomethylpyrimidine synthase, partial [Verrucomicrobiae bacterium]|nr:phosphomethylpyrimidine synthase [Verrucomicrobiae bacterium]
MITPNEPDAAGNSPAAPADAATPDFPNSRRVYVEGSLYPEVRVPMREISLTPTKSFNGEIEENEPVRVYDASGPWGDPDFQGDVTKGLPALRREWIAARQDVEAYEGRAVKPMDNGYLSDRHAEYAST